MAGVWWGKLHEQLIKAGDMERKKMKKESNKKDKILLFSYKIQAQLVNLQTSFFFFRKLEKGPPDWPPVSGFQWLHEVRYNDKNFAKFCQILLSRFWDIVVLLHLFAFELSQQNNGGSEIFP